MLSGVGGRFWIGAREEESGSPSSLLNVVVCTFLSTTIAHRKLYHHGGIGMLKSIVKERGRYGVMSECTPFFFFVFGFVVVFRRCSSFPPPTSFISTLRFLFFSVRRLLVGPCISIALFTRPGSNTVGDDGARSALFAPLSVL